MSEAVRFLTAFAQGLATMALYADGHPARERAVDVAYTSLHELQRFHPRQVFTFMGGEVVHGADTLPALADWEWSNRLAAAGVQRLELDEAVDRKELEGLMAEILARLTVAFVETGEARTPRRSGIRAGAVGVRGSAAIVEVPTVELGYSLADEVQAIRWIQTEVLEERAVPMAEAEAVVRSLTVAMHSNREMVLPLLKLRDHDEYTTAHSMNVSVLCMALAEFAGVPAADVRAMGVAGLLHDIGKARISPALLNKPGRLTAEERAEINRHPEEGARLILASGRNLELAAVVAYEHHIRHDGGGYPVLHYPRSCHPASRLAHVCDVYDALRTHRPYRSAWEAERALGYIEEHAGTEFDPDAAGAFVRMMRRWQPASLDPEHPVVAQPEAA